MGRIFVIALILIIYGSLYPFQFHSRDLAGAPLWTVFTAWPDSVDRFVLKDAVLNILIYVPIGVFGTLWLGGGKPRPRAAGTAVFLALLLSTSIETAQLYCATRTSSALDVVTNVTGAALGAWLAFVYHDTLARVWSHAGLRAALRPSAALLLLCCWIGAQTFPVIPQLSLTMLSLKLTALWHDRSLAPLQMIGALADWLAIGRLLELTRAANWILPLLMIVLPARLLIVGRSVAWPELAGAACAWLLWNRGLRRYRNRARLLAGTAGALLLLRGLVPFHWRSTPAPFTWTPFVSVMESGMLSGAIFFNKTFLYGTAIRLLADAGFSYAISTAAVAALLGAIEAVQVHLPGRTPEITDPLYAVILGGVLKLLDSTDRHGGPSDRTQPGPQPDSSLSASRSY